MKKPFIDSTHFNFLKFVDEEEVNAHLKFVRIAVEMLNDPSSTVPAQTLARGMITAAARISFIAARKMGYNHMDITACEELADLFFQALLDATDNGEVSQILPS